MRGSIVRGLFACILILAACAAPDAGAGALPGSWGGSFSAGYNSNVLGSSNAELDAFHARDPGYLFMIDRIEDWQADLGLWARWDLPSIYRKLRLEVGYERRQPAHNPILGLDTWQVDLRQRMQARNRYVDLSFAYQPQVYLRHRGDPQALPGEPVFRPEAYRGTETKLLYNHPLGSLQAGVYGTHDTRRENRWFRWRNETREGGGVILRIPAWNGADVSPSIEYGSCRSKGDATNPTDRSYRETVLGANARFATPLPAGPWQLEISGRSKLRRYTTGDPFDSSRYRRRDTLWSWSARLGRSAGGVAPFISAEGSGRRISLPPGATASSDEGEYRASLVRAGVEWAFEPKH